MTKSSLQQVLKKPSYWQSTVLAKAFNKKGTYVQWKDFVNLGNFVEGQQIQLYNLQQQVSQLQTYLPRRHPANIQESAGSYKGTVWIG